MPSSRIVDDCCILQVQQWIGVIEATT